jgi:hypothetical protein
MCECGTNGHLDMLQWARAQDPPCPWNEWTCVCAAEKGHLHVLQLVRLVTAFSILLSIKQQPEMCLRRMMIMTSDEILPILDDYYDRVSSSEPQSSYRIVEEVEDRERRGGTRQQLNVERCFLSLDIMCVVGINHLSLLIKQPSATSVRIMK